MTHDPTIPTTALPTTALPTTALPTTGLTPPLTTAPLTPGKARGLLRLSDGEGRFGVLAVDQRPPLMAVAARATGRGLDEVDAEVSELKGLLAEALSDLVTGLLVDPYLGFHTVMPHVGRGTGLLLTLEHHAFEQRPDGHRLSGAIPEWSVERAVACGAEGIKVLAWYRPDAPEDVRAHQQRFVRECGEACRAADRPFIFEILPYPLPGEAPADYGARLPEFAEASAQTFRDPAYRVDLYKLALPVDPARVQEWGGQGSSLAEAGALMAGFTAALPAPWVLLSGGMDTAAFVQATRAALGAGARGYMAGRAVWAAALGAYPDLDATRAALRGAGRDALHALNAELRSLPPAQIVGDYRLRAARAGAHLVQGEY